MKFIMLCGVSGSGKSTLAKELATGNTVHLASDAIRQELYGDESEQKNPGDVFDIMYKRTVDNLRAGRDVIYDATNTSAKRRANLLDRLTRAVPGVKTELHLVMETPEQCLANQELRTRQVPEYAIHRQLIAWTMPSLNEAWTEPIHVHNRNFDARNGYMDTLLDACKDLSQTSKWHQESLDMHQDMVYNYAKSHGFAEIVCDVARYHDIGKPGTRSVDDEGSTHFYGHASLGAYLYLCANARTGVLSHENWQKANLIQHHMDLQQNMSREKLIAAVGEEMLGYLEQLHEADEHGAIREEALRSMSVLDFMNTFPDWEERIHNPPFCVETKKDGPYVLLKYNQLASDFSIRLVQESRGSIFRQGEDGQWKYVCRPFDKFFNHGEANAASLDWDSARILSKIDGCFPGNARVIMGDGTLAHISYVKERHMNGEELYVMSYNMETGIAEPKKVTNVKCTLCTDVSEWVTIQFGANTDVPVNVRNTAMVATKNHIVFVLALDGSLIERAAGDLVVGDIVVGNCRSIGLHYKVVTAVTPGFRLAKDRAYDDRYKYDIEVEDNHNYFCQGILVHNSLMKVWAEDGEWHLSTNGNIDAFKAPVGDLRESFGDVFLDALGKDWRTLCSWLDPSCTYMFELTHPDTRVVIDHEKGVWYLSRRDTQTGEELFNRPALPGVKYPDVWELRTLDDVIRVVSGMSKDEEGVVINDKYGNRLKVKSPEYLIAAKIHNNGVVSNRNLVERLQAGTLDDVVAYCPALKPRVDQLLSTFNNMCADIEKAWDEVKDFSGDRREFAAMVSKNKHFAFLFLRYDNPELTAREFLLNSRLPALMRYLGLKDTKERQSGNINKEDMENVDKSRRCERIDTDSRD